MQRKGNQKKARPGRDPSGYARRFPALLAERGDGAQLAALKHVRLFAPRSTAVLGSLYGRGSQKPTSKCKSNNNSNGNGNGSGNAAKGPAKTATVAYIVRAVTPGSFVHPAATVEDMYRPDRFARTAAGRLDVTAKE